VTSKREKLTILKNAFANVVRGGASALVALFVPPFLTRAMAPDAYGAWALVLQLSAYVGYLDFGIQTAVARFVARATELKDSDYRDRIVNTSLFTLAFSGLLAWIAVLMLAVCLPRIFHHLPAALLSDVRVSLILVAGSLAVGLPASVFNGIFVGLQRNEIPAAIIGSSRLLSAVLVIWIARHGGNLAQMGLAMAMVNLGSYAFQYRMCLGVVRYMHLSPRLISKATIFELADYCFSLTVWSVGLLLVTGLDLTIVGIFRFQDVAYYAVAATAITFFGGFYNAIFSPMVPAAAVLHARGDGLGLGRMVVVTSRYGMLLLLTTGLPLILGATPLLKVWVGTDYAFHTALILKILVIANILRMCITPYIVAMIGTGQQRLVIVTPLLEGITNLVFSLAGGYFLGAVGVAFGTLIGAMVGLAGGLFYNMRRTVAIKFGLGEYIRDSLLRPCLCTVPVGIAITLLHALPQLQPKLRIGLGAIGTMLTLAFCWGFGLTSQERHMVRIRVQHFIIRFQG
jgi:O-antigen/teichoic acid export membrane protein